jgi:hypothetical protein
MNNEQKHTQQLVDQFRHTLLLRSNYISENEDTLSESFSGDDLISLQNQWSDELIRIESILKLMKKGKI